MAKEPVQAVRELGALANGTPLPLPISKLSKKAFEELQLLQSRIQTLSTAELVWTQLLTPTQRAPFDNSLERAIQQHASTLGLLTHVWKCSPARALLRVAHELGTLPPAKLRWLAQELGEELKTEHAAAHDNKPTWNRALGRLYWKGKEIRFIRSISKAQNIVKVLDVFEAAGWPDSVENPPRHFVAEELRETVKSLNRGLKQIRFETTGMAVRWRKA